MPGPRLQRVDAASATDQLVTCAVCPWFRSGPHVSTDAARAAFDAHRAREHPRGASSLAAHRARRVVSR